MNSSLLFKPYVIGIALAGIAGLGYAGLPEVSTGEMSTIAAISLSAGVWRIFRLRGFYWLIIALLSLVIVYLLNLQGIFSWSDFF